jgi:hypothetical protein
MISPVMSDFYMPLLVDLQQYHANVLLPVVIVLFK